MAILLTATFHLFKTKLLQVKIQLIKIQLKTKYMDPTLNGSAINLTLAICQMIKFGANSTKPINPLDKIKFNLELHKPLLSAQLIALVLHSKLH